MATTEERLNNLEQQVSNTMTKVDMLIQEMRDRDNQRAAEIMELRQKQDAMQAKHDSEMHELNTRFYEKVDSLSTQIHDTWKQTMIGVGGMIIALGALLISALK